MKRADPANGATLPPLRTLESALHKTTDALVREIATPTAEAPDWSDFEWRMAEAAAVMHGICALLARRLRWRGPKRWEAFLAEQRHHTQLRRQRMAQILERIDAQARAAGVPFVALKGPALYQLGLYPADERPMGDIDLLVRSADSNAAAKVLTAMGYRENLSTERHRVFEPPEGPGEGGFGEHIGNPLKIELHTRIAEHLPLHLTDITALEFPELPFPGLNAYPSQVAVMRHLLLHASCNIRTRALRAIQLHDIALLAERMSGADWERLLSEGTDERGLWWALAPLTLTARYYPNAIPRSIVQATASGSPWLLRRAVKRHGLADVSWSNLRVRAFPGIEWSRSLPEAAGFMLSRIFPERKALDDLKYLAKVRLDTSAVPWYGLSHFNRIVRWVFLHPPRVQAMYPIKVVLGVQPLTSPQ